jgi:SP family general alpha glucoside:H+ symporter-like MFS transporter
MDADTTGFHTDRYRSHAVRRNRPITISTSNPSPSLEGIHRPGLRYLASLFRPLDEAFFMVWNGAARDCRKEWLLQLEHDLRTALPSILDISDEETANIRVSQYWLQIKLWELFPRYGFLSSESVYECLTFRYPLEVAKEFTSTAIALPVSSLQVHGIGMVGQSCDSREYDIDATRPRRCSTSHAPS